MRVFISYRRDDSAVTARLIHNELCQRFGERSVFMDVDDIGWGDDFGRVIDDHLRHADVVLVIIGPRWAELLQERVRGDDWVRHEVKVALERMGKGKARVLPVRVGGAPWPCAALTPDIAGFGALDAREVTDRELRAGIVALSEAVQAKSFEQIAREERRRRWVQRAAFVGGLAVFVAAWTSLLDRLYLDTLVHELTMQLAHLLPGTGPTRSTGEVVLIAIDEASVSSAGRPFGPEWREDVAAVVERVGAAGAQVLALDIKFVSPGSEPGNAALERAFAAVRARLPVVVAVQDVTPGGEPHMLPRLRPHVSWGVACIGGTLGAERTLPLAYKRARDDALVPFLALAAYVGGDHSRLYRLNRKDLTLSARPIFGSQIVDLGGYSAEIAEGNGNKCSAVQPGDLILHQLMDARVVSEVQPRTVLSFGEVLQGDTAALLVLKGRFVLVGDMTDPGDLKTTTAGERYGVELIAAQLDRLLARQAVRPLHWLVQVLLAILLAMAGSGAAAVLRGRRKRWLWLAIPFLGIAYAFVSVLWYQRYLELASAHYGIAALVLGAWLERRINREVT